MTQVFIHSSAIVETTQIGEGTRIWAYTHVMGEVTIGADCNIGDHCFIESGATIGNQVTIKNGNMVWEGVHLEDGVFVGPLVVFTNDLYPRSPRLSQVQNRYADRGWLKPTVVKQGASLGAGSVVLAGITIGEFCMVGAGSIVNRSVPPYALVVGSPARQRGWVCQCGQPLAFSNDAAACADCGLEFIKTDNAVELAGGRLPDVAGEPSEDKRRRWPRGSITLNSSRARKVAHWFALRDARYICFRLFALVRRYGISASRAKKRVLACVDRLARYECRPTFPTPGQVVGRNGAFCRELQRRGAELAVHGYHHLDFRALSADESRNQFAEAEAAYQLEGIQFEGFRCPYLSYTEQLNDTLPNGHFQYSSNKAIWWDVVVPESEHGAGYGAKAVFQGLSRFYQAESSKTHLAVPRMSDGLVEIPVCLPDDLQLLDGLKLDERGMRRAWIDLLRQTHRRGELFDLMFHPESFEQCGPALEAVLREARDLDPSVWIAQLREVNRWWREKSAFTVERIQDGPALRLTFHCSERATVLVRHLDIREPARAWYGPYRVLEGRTLRLGADERPWIGVAADTPSELVAFLRDQGYIVETGPEAPGCAIYLSPTELADSHNQVQLIDFIETSSAPLVRFWRWPAEARSALCVTGDLDALSLTDYLARVFAL